MQIANAEVVQGFYYPEVEPILYDILKCRATDFIKGFEEEIIHNGLQNFLGSTHKLTTQEFSLEFLKDKIVTLHEMGYINHPINFVTITDTIYQHKIKQSENAHFYYDFYLTGEVENVSLFSCLQENAVNIILFENFEPDSTLKSTNAILQLINTRTEPSTGNLLPDYTIIFSRRLSNKVITDMAKQRAYGASGTHYHLTSDMVSSLDTYYHGIGCNCIECTTKAIYGQLK